MITKEEILTHWKIQESLLQGYRLIFLTAQTILFSTDAVIVSTQSVDEIRLLVFSVVLTIALMLLNYGYKIANARGLDVSYLQSILYHINEFEQKDNLMREFKSWQKFSQSDKELFLKQHSIEPSRTRMIMEKRIPFLFLILWIVLGLVELYGYYKSL